MQSITIQAHAFFEKIKSHQLSMWDIMEQMIDGAEKEIVFVDDNGNVLMQYILPKNKEKLKLDQKEFAKLLLEKFSDLN